MDVLGKEYIIEHAVDYYKQTQEKKAFELYISEMLRSLNNSVAKNFGGNEFNKSWLQLKEYEPETRSAEEIKTNMLTRLQSLGGGTE